MSINLNSVSANNILSDDLSQLQIEELFRKQAGVTIEVKSNYNEKLSDVDLLLDDSIYSDDTNDDYMDKEKGVKVETAWINYIDSINDNTSDNNSDNISEILSTLEIVSEEIDKIKYNDKIIINLIQDLSRQIQVLSKQNLTMSIQLEKLIMSSRSE